MSELAQTAEMLVADLGGQGLELDYSPESLAAIDEILASYGSAPGNGETNMGLVELAGAYFGEVLRRNLGGRWVEDVPPDGATGLLLDDEHEFFVWCHSIVYKQLEEGGKSLAAIYGDAATRLADLRAG